MGTERRNYVMSVGLAMQREMAFRQKLQRLVVGCGSKNFPFPFQIPNSGPAHPYIEPRPGQVPLPMPNVWYRGPVPGMIPLMRPQFPSPHPRPSPLSGPAPSTTGQKRKQPVQGENNFYCDLCEIDCTSSFNLKMHFKGQKHKAKLIEALKGIKIKPARGTGTSQGLHCELCDIWCSGEYSLWQHYNGRNHMAKLHPKENETNGPESDGSTAVNNVHSTVN